MVLHFRQDSAKSSTLRSMNTPDNTPRRSTVRTGLVGVAVTTAALVGGLTVLPSLAGAQDNEPEAPESPSPESEQPDAARHRHPRGFLKHKSEVVSDLLDMEPEAVREAFLDGTTLAELSEAQGLPVGELISALVSDAEAQVAEHLDAGQITEEQADRILDGLEERITERVYAERPVREGRGRRGHGQGSEIVSELLGMTTQEIRDGFEAGNTLAELAQAQGVSSEQLVDALVAEAEARVTEKVESGDISQDRADSILGNMEERIENRVNSERPLDRPGRGRHSGNRRAPAAQSPDA
jgi:lambda repressor-like predicted transcriptional regulator